MKIVYLVALLLPTGVSAAPDGAVACPPDMGAVVGIAAHGEAAPIDWTEGGLSLEVDGTMVAPGASVEVSSDSMASLTLTASEGNEFRGFLIRADGAVSLEPGDAAFQAASACSDPVLGVTHTENSMKSMASVDLEPGMSETITIDVTVVQSNNAMDGSSFSYAQFVLTVTGIDPSAPTDPPVAAPTPPMMAPEPITEMMDYMCYEGYISDTFCIEQGAFVDLPQFHPLVNPENHTAKCLVGPQACRNSYEILMDPGMDGSNWTRAVKIDDNTTMIEYITARGADCEVCMGDMIRGLRATVVGYLFPETTDNDPPTLMTHAIVDSDVGCSSVMAEPNYCVEGFISDDFCISQGGFVDLPELNPLQYPQNHTAKCAVNPPQCRASLEILNDPVDGGNATRAVSLDVVGAALMTTYIRRIGAGCNGCTGTQVAGLRATVFGVLDEEVGDSAEMPPVMKVTHILDSSVGCSKFFSESSGYMYGIAVSFALLFASVATM